jgi:hypothetical protein
LAPVTDLLWKARKATKNETNEVAIKNTEYIVKTRSMLFIIFQIPLFPGKKQNTK